MSGEPVRQRILVRVLACALALQFGVVLYDRQALVEAQAQTTKAPIVADDEDSDDDDGAESEGGKEKEKGRRFRLPGKLVSLGRQEVPETRRIDDPIILQTLQARATQTMTPMEAIGKALGKPSVCDQNIDAVDPNTMQGNRTSIDNVHRGLINRITRPIGRSAADFTFEWYESDQVNCRTDLRRKNTFQCSTALLNIKFTDENDPTKKRRINQRELGFIFAHEIAHIVLGHDKGAAEAAKRAEMFQTLASTAALVGALSEARYTRDATGALQAEIGIDSLNAIWVAAGIGDVLSDSSCDIAGADYARTQESEADYMALDMITRADWGGVPGIAVVRPDELNRMLTALKSESNFRFNRTAAALSGGISQYASRALLEAATGQSLRSSGLGSSGNDFMRTQALRIGLSVYADYRNRQGLAFHPDPVRRALRITTYRDKAWAAEIAELDRVALAAAEQRFLNAAAASAATAAAAVGAQTGATPAGPTQTAAAAPAPRPLPPEVIASDAAFARDLEQVGIAVGKATTAPADLILALVELNKLEQDEPEALPDTATAEQRTAAATAAQERTRKIAELRTTVETNKALIGPGPNAYPDFALSQYFAYKKDKTRALQHAVAATTKQRPSAGMFTYAAELQIEAAQTPAALSTVTLGATQFGETEYYPLLIRIHTLLKDEAALTAVRQRCAADLEAPAATKAACLPPGAAPTQATAPAGAAAAPSPSPGAAVQSLGRALSGLSLTNRKAATPAPAAAPAPAPTPPPPAAPKK